MPSRQRRDGIAFYFLTYGLAVFPTSRLTTNNQKRKTKNYKQQNPPTNQPYIKTNSLV